MLQTQMILLILKCGCPSKKAIEWLQKTWITADEFVTVDDYDYHFGVNYPFTVSSINSVFRNINLPTTVCSRSKWNETSSRVGGENPSWLHHPICQYSQIKSFFKPIECRLPMRGALCDCSLLMRGKSCCVTADCRWGEHCVLWPCLHWDIQSRWVRGGKRCCRGEFGIPLHQRVLILVKGLLIGEAH